MSSHLLHPRAVRCSLLVLVGSIGCAHGGQAPNGPQSVAMQAASGQLGPALLEWSGKFKSTQQQSIGVEMRALNIASGSVVLTAPDERQTRVRLSVSGPNDETVMLHWAVVPGACRSGAIPLMPVSAFPELRMSNGRGELDQLLSLPIPTSGSYHVNIYTNDSGDETGVMTCAELKLTRRQPDR